MLNTHGVLFATVTKIEDLSNNTKSHKHEYIINVYFIFQGIYYKSTVSLCFRFNQKCLTFSVFKNVWLAVLITPSASTYPSWHTTLPSPLSLHFHKPSEYCNRFKKKAQCPLSKKTKTNIFHIPSRYWNNFPGEDFVDTNKKK